MADLKKTWEPWIPASVALTENAFLREYVLVTPPTYSITTFSTVTVPALTVRLPLTMVKKGLLVYAES